MHYFGQLIETALADNPRGKDRALSAIREIVVAPSGSAHQQLAQLIDIIGREIDDPAFGFDLLSTAPLTSFGKGGLVIQTAPDFRRALDAIVDYAEIELLLYFFSYTINDDFVRIEVKARYPIAEGYEVGLAAVVHSTNLLIGAFTGQTHNLTELRSHRPELLIGPEVTKRTGAKVTTGCDVDEVVFPVAVLDTPNPLSDPITYDRLLIELARDLERLRKSELAEFIRMRVRAEIAAPPSQAELARDAKMSERSFRHALSKQGTSYQKLVRDVRQQFAETALQEDHLSIAEIGYQLGFADPSNFTSSFKRWTGQTPKDYRAALGSGAG